MRRLALPLLLALGPSVASAAGFYVSDVGTQGMARGGAFVAGPDSLLAIHYNPAGLSLLGPGLHLQIDFQLVALSETFTRSCPCVSPELSNAAELDAELSRKFAPASNIAAPQPIPTLWVAYGLDWHKLTVGAGVWAITSPGRAEYGASDYASAIRQPQRYSLIELHLFEVFMAGAASIEVVEGLRVGVVAGAYAFNVTQTQNLWANTNLTAEPENVQLDIPVKLAFTAPVRVMWNAGISYSPSFLPKLTLGASVLGKRSARAPGTVEITVPPLVTQTGGSITGQNVDVEVNLPPTFRAGVQWDEPGLFELEAAVAVESWSVYQQVVIRPRDVVITLNGMSEPLAKIVIDTKYKDTFSLRLGGELKVFEPWLGVRAGYFFEPSATPLELLDVSSVDLDKHGFTLGLGTSWSGLRLELGAALILMPEVVVTDSDRKLVGPLAPPQGDNTLLTTIGNGSYSGSTFIFGASIGMSLDRLLGDDAEPTPAPKPAEGIVGGEG